jgi:hypothetical protein
VVSVKSIGEVMEAALDWTGKEKILKQMTKHG